MSDIYSYNIEAEKIAHEKILHAAGMALAISGAALSVLGSTANNLYLNHIPAMWLWLFGNPFLMLWGFGMIRGWWRDGLSIVVVTAMYTYFFVTGAIGLLIYYGVIPNV
jgi:ABC-type Na+ efflux pump permease subunit